MDLKSFILVILLSTSLYGGSLELNTWQPDCVYAPSNSGNIMFRNSGTSAVANWFPQVAPAEWSGEVIVGALGERWKGDGNGKYILGPAVGQYTGRITCRVNTFVKEKTQYPVWIQCDPATNESVGGGLDTIEVSLTSLPTANSITVQVAVSGNPPHASARGTETKVIDGVLVGKAYLESGTSVQHGSYDGSTTYTDVNGDNHPATKMYVAGVIYFGGGYSGGATPDNPGGNPANYSTSMPTVTSQPSKWLDDAAKGMVTGDDAVIKKAFEKTDTIDKINEKIGAQGVVSAIKTKLDQNVSDADFKTAIYNIAANFGFIAASGASTPMQDRLLGGNGNAGAGWYGGLPNLLTKIIDEYRVWTTKLSVLFTFIRVTVAAIFSYFLVLGVWRRLIWTLGIQHQGEN